MQILVFQVFNGLTKKKYCTKLIIFFVLLRSLYLFTAIYFVFLNDFGDLRKVIITTNVEVRWYQRENKTSWSQVIIGDQPVHMLMHSNYYGKCKYQWQSYANDKLSSQNLYGDTFIQIRFPRNVSKMSNNFDVDRSFTILNANLLLLIESKTYVSRV